ncbi:hypothetical protein [Verrucosispora sp. WMMC514]|uniref:hypothetical protein n=1 Tax=Verrucosispora sp. WMMC514 TaxID=3015156 RepID=UPI00248C51B8|nr:hypothetical protein [Verrucosispora sp. WMMC514]WBB94167.1 hypothetical protein O7597_15060 [Verrucosispora sp. WMMC514]
MPGQPQVREHAWLYLDDSGTPAASVRVEEHRDDTGRWAVLHNVPAEAATERSEHDTAEQAHGEAARLRKWIDEQCRAQHGITGRWTVHTRKPY